MPASLSSYDVIPDFGLLYDSVRAFDLGETFALVIAPFRVLQQLPTIEEQLGFLSAAARHVAPGGRFIFDVFNPNFAALAPADGIEREDTPSQALPDGRTFRRARSSFTCSSARASVFRRSTEASSVSRLPTDPRSR